MIVRVSGVQCGWHLCAFHFNLFVTSLNERSKQAESKRWTMLS